MKVEPKLRVITLIPEFLFHRAHETMPKGWSCQWTKFRTKINCVSDVVWFVIQWEVCVDHFQFYTRHYRAAAARKVSWFPSSGTNFLNLVFMFFCVRFGKKKISVHLPLCLSTVSRPCSAAVCMFCPFCPPRDTLTIGGENCPCLRRKSKSALPAHSLVSAKLSFLHSAFLQIRTGTLL